MYLALCFVIEMQKWVLPTPRDTQVTERHKHLADKTQHRRYYQRGIVIYLTDVY